MARSLPQRVDRLENALTRLIETMEEDRKEWKRFRKEMEEDRKRWEQLQKKSTSSSRIRKEIARSITDN